MSPQVAKRSVNSGGTILKALSGNSGHLVVTLAGFRPNETKPKPTECLEGKLQFHRTKGHKETN